MKLPVIFRRKTSTAVATTDSLTPLQKALVMDLAEDIARGMIQREYQRFQALATTIDERIAERTSNLAVAGQGLQMDISRLSGRIQRLEHPNMPADGEPGSGVGIFPRPRKPRETPTHEARHDTLHAIGEPSQLRGEPNGHVLDEHGRHVDSDPPGDTQ